jgi:hypothetical protein
MKEKIDFFKMNQVFQSYFGIMSHGNCRKLDEKIKNEYWIYSVSGENDLQVTTKKRRHTSSFLMPFWLFSKYPDSFLSPNHLHVS